MLDDQDMVHTPQYSTSSRKRKREADHMSFQDQQHQLWADALLDYFMLLDSEEGFVAPPEPPLHVNLDRAIDEKGHSAIHWAAAMGDIDVVKELIRRGARVDCLSNNLETPLMRAVMFTNNFDKNVMPSMVKIFQQTVVRKDWFNSTVFHHIAATTSSTNKFLSARYYLDCIINKLSETWIPDEITRILNEQDNNGDTAIMIAARHGARKCVRSLLGRNASVDIRNHKGETADDLIRELNERRKRQGRLMRQLSSSPFAPPSEYRSNGVSSHESTRSGPPARVPFPGFPSREASQYRSQTASHLMTKVAPVFFEKCQELAGAYEGELREKETEIQDAERVIKKRQAELEATRRQVSDIQNLRIDLSDEANRKQEEELRLVVEEAESLLEIEQKTEVRRLCSKTPQHQQSLSDIQEKLRLSVLLHVAQVERRDLVRKVVSSLSVAGLGQKAKIYKMLVAKALNETEEKVEAIIPEMLKELEDAETQDRAEKAREGLEGSPS